jgi:phage FluMu protein Com
MAHLIGTRIQYDWHMEKIKCPRCGTVQWAKVEHTTPWMTYIHHCKTCDWLVMESDWGKPILILPKGVRPDES